LHLNRDEIFKKGRGIPYPAIECDTKLHPKPLLRRPFKKGNDQLILICQISLILPPLLWKRPKNLPDFEKFNIDLIKKKVNFVKQF